MRTTDRLDNLLPEITGWRREIHRHPELGYDVHNTARFVVDKLREFGVDDIVEGVGQTGVVGVIKGRQSTSGKVVGLRADMDALPITEATGAAWASETPGLMHACGHDGHTAMLLGAARALADSRNFDGTVVLIFQPAEEGGAGGQAMVKDGLMERFGIQEVYGMHNMPALPVGEFAIRPGPLMACADEFEVIVHGRGGHAAMPHECIDSLYIASHIVIAAQGIVSRQANPVEPVVLSFTTMEVDGEAFNVIAQTTHMRGTLRAFDEQARQQAKDTLVHLCQQTAQAFGGTAQVNYRDGYPATINNAEKTDFAVEVARSVVGHDKVNPAREPMMAAEDFSYMLNERPGAFIFLGNGDSKGLHHAQYDFDDEAIRFGCQYWINLVGASMPLSGQ